MSQDETLQKLLDRRDSLAVKHEKLTRQRERLEKKQREVEQEVSALNMVLQGTLGIEPPSPPANPRRSASGRRMQANTLTSQVRSAIADLSGAFVAKDVAALLQESGNEHATEEPVRKVLARLARVQKEIEVEHKGAGTAPSVYRRRAQVEEAIGGHQHDDNCSDPPSWADSRPHATESVAAGA